MSNVRPTADTDPRIAGGSTQIPNALLRSPHLCMEEKLLYGVLYSHQWQPDSVIVTQRLLAYETATSERQIRRWLNRLEDLGLVRVVQQGLQKPNIYELPPIPRNLLALGDPPDGSEMTGPDQPNSERSEMAGQDRSRRTNTSGPGRSKEADKQRTSGQGAVPSDKSEPNDSTSSGSPGKGVDEPDAARGARTRARVNSARVKDANSEVKPLLHRHGQAYQAKVGAPFPIAWGKDGAIIKRLLRTYSAEEIERLQDAFFAQPVDSAAGRRGYSLPQFSYEAPALMAGIKLRDGLTQAQRDLVAALQGEGVAETTALALVGEFPEETIRRQLAAHEGRRPRFSNPAAALVKAIRDGWEVQSEGEAPYYQPLKPVDAKGTAGPPPPEIRAQLEHTLQHLTGKGAG